MEFCHSFLTMLVIVVFALTVIRLLRSSQTARFSVLVIAILTVSVGEFVNLLGNRPVIYPGTDSFPVYVVFGGALLALMLYDAATHLARLSGHDCRFGKLSFCLLFSLLLPLVEISGIAFGFWQWRRPIDILSFTWLAGVWIFYLMFIVTPALAVILSIKTCCKRN